MLYQSDEELEKRLPEYIHKQMYGTGRQFGAKDKPFELKVAAGALARVIGNQATSEILDVSPSQAYNYSKGMTTQSEGKQAELSKAVDNRLGTIHNAALEKLLLSINSIDEDKLRKGKPRDQAAIAKDLAGVIEKTSPKNDQINVGQVVIYAPRQNSMDDYEAPIDITSEKV